VTGSLDRSMTLLLGRFDDGGTLRCAGQTHRAKGEHQRDLAKTLGCLVFQGPSVDHPWPCPLPAAWAGTFADRQALPFTPVEPTVVAEIEVDTALDGPLGRIRDRGRLVRIRRDLQARDVTTRQGEALAGLEFEATSP
jgi:hypothetical protein